MEKFLWGIVPIAAMATGIYMVLWPAEAAIQNRDDKEDTSPPSADEIWWTRGIGLAMLAAGAYGLYRMLGGTWGAGDGRNNGPALI